MTKTIPIWEWTNEYYTTTGFVVYKSEVSEDVINALSLVATKHRYTEGDPDCVYDFEYHFHVDPELTEYTLSILELIGEVVHGKWTSSKHDTVYRD